MRQMITVVALATLAIVPPAVLAQESVPSSPPLSAGQAQQVQRDMDAYRGETDARVARGEITPDEAQRLLQWREWQLAQQAAGLAPPPPADRVVVAPPPLYPAPRYYYPYPYYAPYYVTPGWGVSVCAGRAFHHGFGSFCI